MSSKHAQIIILIITQVGLSMAQFCNTAYECVDTQWKLSPSQYIYGHGYKSLSGSSTSLNTTAIGGPYCYGSYACTETLFIVSQSWVSCSGSHSCSNIAGTKYIDTNKIRSRGANSCENSNIKAKEIVYCDSDQSCNYANISTPEVYAYGSYSLYRSTIDTNSIPGGNLTIYLWGYQSGFGGTVICRHGVTCYIYCYFNGCQMLYLLCEDVNNCNWILNSNDPTITVPPITNVNDFDDDLYDLKHVSYKTDTLCNNLTNNFTYDNYQQKKESINMHGGGSVCCRGAESCKVNMNIGNGKIVCSGEKSCQNANINTTGPVFCEGTDACYSTQINGSDNIYCLGSAACVQSVIIQPTNIYCSGTFSCGDGQIESNGKNINIYLLGYQSGGRLDIYCAVHDECIITCGAYDSCRSDTILYCNNNCLVHCNNDTGCPIGNYTEITLRSTTDPTVVPTINPTIHTKYPSLGPSTAPSEFTAWSVGCSDVDIGFLNMTYKLSIGPEVCKDGILFTSFIAQFSNSIDAEYAENNLYVKSTIINAHKFKDITACGNVSLNIVTCYNESLNKLINLTTSYNFTNAINDAIDINVTVVIIIINNIVNIQNDKPTKSRVNLMLLWSLIVSVVFMIFIVIFIVFYCRKLKRDRENLTIKFTNPMVITIGIGDYENDLWADLSVDIDIENLAKLFKDTLNYQLYPPFNTRNTVKLRWSQKELILFLFAKAKEFDESIYDGLVVVLTGHGLTDYIVTSDGKAVEKQTIHRIFSYYYPRNRQKPRLFVFDSCDGNNDRNHRPRAGSHGAKSINNDDFKADEDDNIGNISDYVDGKIINFEFIKSLAKTDEAWNKYENNPDYRLCTVFASNRDYQSKMDIRTGSYLITEFVNRMITNIDIYKNKYFLFNILDEIQNDLHSLGKQLSVNTFNNETRYIKFIPNLKNKQQPANDGDMMGDDIIEHTLEQMIGKYIKNSELKEEQIKQSIVQMTEMSENKQ